MRHVRGNDITIIFQEPMASLNPLHTIEKQIGEILSLHQGLTGRTSKFENFDLLGEVGIPDPAGRLPGACISFRRQLVVVWWALAVIIEPRDLARPMSRRPLCPHRFRKLSTLHKDTCKGTFQCALL